MALDGELSSVTPAESRAGLEGYVSQRAQPDVDHPTRTNKYEGIIALADLAVEALLEEVEDPTERESQIALLAAHRVIGGIIEVAEARSMHTQFPDISGSDT